MKISNRHTDDAICVELGSRLARIRLNRNQTQAQLAESAGVSKRTVERLENGESVQLTNFIRVCRELELIDRMDAMIPEPIPSPLDQVKRRDKQRRRASSHNHNKAENTGDEWKWGDES